MKVLKLAIFVSLAFMFSNKEVRAQGAYGTGQDSIDCVKNLNFYREDYKRKDYKAAYTSWKEAIRLCPQSSRNLYIHGVNIMKYHINTLKDPAQKNAAVDSLLKLYDLRMEYFKENKSDLLYRKADAIEEYYPEKTEEVYKAYLSAIEVDKKKGLIMAAAKAMIEAKKMYEANKIDANKFADIFTMLSDIAEQRVKSTINDSVANNEALTCKAVIENAFISTDAANCDNLIKLFTPRFEANKDDMTTVGSIVKIFTMRECTQNDLFYQAAEAYYKLDPSPQSAYTLAIMFYSKGELDKSIQYYKDAIDGQTDPADKSNYQVALSTILLKQGQTGQAMSYAKQAINTNSRNGKAYMILAATYAGIKGCGNDAVSNRSVFWAAYDLLQRARNIETDPKVIDDINKQMNLYRQNFPSYDDCFDLDILDGQPYTISCGGINERTTVRTRK